MIVVCSSSVLKTIKDTLTAAGFRCRPRSRSESDCWEWKEKHRSTSCDKSYSKSQTCASKTKTAGSHSRYSESCKKPKPEEKCEGFTLCTRCTSRPMSVYNLCQSCDKKYEKSKGNQPFGTMEITKNAKKLPGHESSEGTLVIKYTFAGGVQIVSSI